MWCGGRGVVVEVWWWSVWCGGRGVVMGVVWWWSVWCGGDGCGVVIEVWCGGRGDKTSIKILPTHPPLLELSNNNLAQPYNTTTHKVSKNTPTPPPLSTHLANADVIRRGKVVVQFYQTRQHLRNYYCCCFCCCCCCCC